MSNSDPIEQQLRKDFEANLLDGNNLYTESAGTMISAQHVFEWILEAFDTYAARRAGLGDLESPSETAPALSNQVDNLSAEKEEK